MGQVPAAVSTLTQIISDILGWETVTNPSVAILGTLTQSDESARMYRRQTLFAQGSSLAGAMYAAMFQAGATSLWFQENVSSMTQTINGVVMVPYSIYACVEGGTDLAIATAMVSKKSGGCAYNNGASSQPVSIDVTEPFSGQVMDVLFDRPDIETVVAVVTVSINASVQNPQQAVIDAILAYANGQIDGEPGFVVGSNVSPFQLAGAINIQAPGIFVHNVEICFAGGTPAPDELTINPWQLATIVSSSITVNVV